MVLNFAKICSYFFVTFSLILLVFLEMQQKLQQPVPQFNPLRRSFTVHTVHTVHTVPPASELKFYILLSECVNLFCMISSINSNDVPQLHQPSLLYNGNTFCFS